VSAVAVTLGLMLVVTFLSNYLVFQLPGAMGQVEFEHVIQVENQLSRLQATILAQATHPSFPLSISSPVTLGSGSVPPFGPPSLGSIGPETNGVSQSVNYQLDSVTPAEPNWGAFSDCLPGGSGHCAGNGNVNFANLSGNNTTLLVKVTGSNNSLVYNINGDNNTLNIDWSGKDEGIVAIVVNGSYDTVTFSKSGSDTTVPTMNFYFFGIHDTYSMSMAGSHSSNGGMNVNVRFIGSLNYLCPYDNYSATDSVGALGAGGSKLNMTVTWWNAIGYASPVHLTKYPGGSIPTEQIAWQNQTGFQACPFLILTTNQYRSSMFGGIAAHLANLYQPPADIAYENGAVVLVTPGQQALMISAPEFYFNETSSGISATLLLVQLAGKIVAQSGITTASVVTRVTSVASTVFGAGVHGVFLATPYYLNLTTQFPGAWSSYFGSLDQAFPAGARCVVLGPPLASGYSCLAPPPGRAMEIVAPLFAQVITVTTVQVAVSVG
jgi:hypothetical protein